MDIKITKIKVKDDYVEVLYNNAAADNKTTKDTKFKSYVKPHPDLKNALARLDTDVIEILELPDKYIDGLEVSSVAIIHEAEGIGCVISATKKLESCDSPFCLNTPYKPPERNEHQKNSISLNLAVKLGSLMAEAYKYMFENKTAQIEMDFEKAEAVNA